ncbi:MAG: M1 family aminopeptidase, partial [Candidatus Heimdallarchaeota archaeon]
NDPIKWCGSDHETERARHWIPCIDYPNVRNTLRWELTSAEIYTMLANGKFISETINGDGTKTVIWDHNHRCPSYLAAIAIGELTEFKDRVVDAGKGPIPIVYYAIKKFSAEDLQRSFGRTPEMIEWYVKKFNHPLPWDKYYQFAFPDFGGAMENQSLVSWDDWAMLNRESFEEYGEIIDAVNIHELAHTFFGDLLIMSHFSHAWLKESWATYVDALWHEDIKGTDYFQYELFKNANSYFEEVDKKYLRPIVHNYYNSSWQLFDKHLYPGGAWRLHMLRNMLGDNQFFSAIKDYVNSFAGKLVETVDFKRTLEKHSGLNLTEFFYDWLLTAKGFPDLDIEFVYENSEKRGKFMIIQKQVKKDDPIRKEPFKLSLEIGIVKEENGPIEIHKFDLKEAHHVFYVNLDSMPYYVQIDPNFRLLIRQNVKIEIKLLIHQLNSPLVMGRVNAIHTLSRTGKRKAIKAVIGHYDREKFFGVRVEIFKALSKTNTQNTIQGFVDFIQKEKDPKILRILFTEASKFRTPSILKALKEAINTGLRPQALSAALIAIGKQRNRDDINFIMKFTKDEGWHYNVRASAYQALAEFRDISIIPQLLEDLNVQVYEARKSIISSLAKLAKYDDKQLRLSVIESLTNLLRDESDIIRLKAVEALGDLKAQSAIPLIEDLKKRHPQQQAIKFERAINKIRDVKSANDLPKLLNQVEKMSNEINKLKSNLQELEAKVDKDL